MTGLPTLMRFVFLAALLQLPPQDPASIEGTIVDGNTNMPLSNVNVSRSGGGSANPLDFVSIAPGNIIISDLLSASSGSLLTDADGHFLLDGINPGTVTVFARKLGYMDLRQDGRSIPGNSTGIVLALAPGQHLHGVVYRMFPAAIVDGRVTDMKGQPVTNVTVYALRQGYNDLGEIVPKPVATTSTDDRGEYRFNNLAPGAYTFRFERNMVRFGQASPVSYYTVYYPGARDLRNAAAVSIESGVETRLNNVTLPSGRGGSLTIHIVRESNAGANSQIVIWRPGEPVDTTSGSFPDPTEGVAGQLPPGTYQIEVETGKSRGYALVDVGEEDLKVNVNVPNPATIVGVAGIGDPHDETKFRPVQNVRLNLLDMIANNSGNRPTLISGADGKFQNPSVKPGLFYVSGFQLPPNMYLVAVREGNRNVFGEKFAIEGGDIELNVIVGEGPGVVRGTVTDDKGNKVPGAVVALLPDDRTQKALMVSKNADGNGVYELQCAPGSYHLYAWMELDGAAYRNVEFMKQFDARGTAVRIENNGKTSVDLTPLPTGEGEATRVRGPK